MDSRNRGKTFFFGWAAAARHEERLFFDELLPYSTQHRMMCALSHGKTASCMKNVHYFVLLFTYVCVPDKSQEKKKRKNMKSLVPAFSIHSTGVLKRKLKFKIPIQCFAKKIFHQLPFFFPLSIFCL